MKLWILRNYLIPSTRFHLMVNQTLAFTISAMKGTITKYIKKWLKRPRNATRAIIYHPSVVKTSCLASVKVRKTLFARFPQQIHRPHSDGYMDKILNDSAFLCRNDVNQETQDLVKKLTKGSQQNHCRQPSGSWHLTCTRKRQSGTRSCKVCRSRANWPTL